MLVLARLCPKNHLDVQLIEQTHLAYAPGVKPMAASQNSQLSIVPSSRPVQGAQENIEPPMSVKEAAKFLGVSPQTVYLWVERKQIPHLRVMGRNIRFLKSDLEPFRASFRQEMVNV
jgi:excisionase family DNA binding protein